MNEPATDTPTPQSGSLDTYRHIARGYDLLASSYDQDVGSNAVGQRMRDVFREILQRNFAARQTVFEIGCGTGIDVLSKKAKAEGLADRIRVAKLRASEIGRLARDYGEESFGGGYCHAGALN